MATRSIKASQWLESKELSPSWQAILREDRRNPDDHVFLFLFCLHLWSMCCKKRCELRTCKSTGTSELGNQQREQVIRCRSRLSIECWYAGRAIFSTHPFVELILYAPYSWILMMWKWLKITDLGGTSVRGDDWWLVGFDSQRAWNWHPKNRWFLSEGYVRLRGWTVSLLLQCIQYKSV